MANIAEHSASQGPQAPSVPPVRPGLQENGMNVPDTPKIIGHCTCCDAACYEVISQFPEGHALAGRPRKIWHILPATRRVEFLLSDSSTMTLTFCGNCADELSPQDYPKIMSRLLVSWAEEVSDGYRAALGLERWADEKKAYYLKRMSGLMMMARWCGRPAEAG